MFKDDSEKEIEKDITFLFLKKIKIIIFFYLNKKKRTSLRNLSYFSIFFKISTNKFKRNTYFFRFTIY